MDAEAVVAVRRVKDLEYRLLAGTARQTTDIVIERETFRLYIPIVSSLLISIVLSVILWLVNR